MFITIHRIFSLPVSLPVRGADGLAKRATYGGFERQRLSSQSVKAHLYGGTGLDTPMSALATKIGEQMSIRSRYIGKFRIAPALIREGVPEQETNTFVSAIMALFLGKEKPEGSDKGSEEDGEEGAEGEEGEVGDAKDASRQVLVLGEQEIEALCKVALTMHSARISPKGKKANKKAGSEKVPGLRDFVAATATSAVRRKLPEPVRDALAVLDAMKTHVGLDGALFGRMATGVAVSRVDSAVHVGHALTVHPIQSAVDFFSAQEQLPDREAGEAGGAHINSRELTTGVYYLPVIIDIDQLGRNGIAENALKDVLEWLVTSVARVTPAAMLGSTAPFVPPGQVVVEVSRRQPVNMMGAFEEPVAPTMNAATTAFDRHIERIWATVGRADAAFRLSKFVDDAIAGGRDDALARFSAAVSDAAMSRSRGQA
jgi:CRISPR system Cascade subunit CasC